MQLSAITLFEFGQFLRIVLWIAVPLIVLSVSIGAYIRQRKKAMPARESREEWRSVFALEEEAFPEVLAKRRPTEKELEAEGETVYRGLLWLKNKYEQDREQSTAKYMQLKEEHEQLKEKNQQLATRYAYTEELLGERQSTIDRLREQLRDETLRTTEAKDKLESSGHLLLKIHQELDQLSVRAASMTETA